MEEVRAECGVQMTQIHGDASGVSRMNQSREPGNCPRESSVEIIETRLPDLINADAIFPNIQTHCKPGSGRAVGYHTSSKSSNSSSSSSSSSASCSAKSA